MEANRDAALEILPTVVGVDAAAISSVCTRGIEAVLAAAATKRAGLEAELVTADGALGEAIDVKFALAELLCSCLSVAPASFAGLDDGALAQHAPALLARFTAVQSAVAAIPERPVTRSFLAVEPAPGPEALRAQCTGMLGVLAVIGTVEVGAHRGKCIP